MNKVKLAKKRYNRAKRRIELGHAKPGDVSLIELLAVDLGYKSNPSLTLTTINTR